MAGILEIERPVPGERLPVAARLIAPVPSASTRRIMLAAGTLRRRLASADAAHKLTLQQDHSVGAGHAPVRRVVVGGVEF